MPTSRVVLIYGLIAVAVLFLVIPAASSGSLEDLAWLVPMSVVGVLVLQGARLEPRLGLPVASVGTLVIVTVAAVISGDSAGEALFMGVSFGAYAAGGTFAIRRMARSHKR